MKQEGDYAITLTDKKGSIASYPGKVVGLCNRAKQSRREKNHQKAETSPWGGGNPAIAGPALGKQPPTAGTWATHEIHSHPQTSSDEFLT